MDDTEKKLTNLLLKLLAGTLTTEDKLQAIQDARTSADEAYKQLREIGAHKNQELALEIALIVRQGCDCGDPKCNSAVAFKILDFGLRELVARTGEEMVPGLKATKPIATA